MGSLPACVPGEEAVCRAVWGLRRGLTGRCACAAQVRPALRRSQMAAAVSAAGAGGTAAAAAAVVASSSSQVRLAPCGLTPREPATRGAGSPQPAVLCVRVPCSCSLRGGAARQWPREARQRRCSRSHAPQLSALPGYAAPSQLLTGPGGAAAALAAAAAAGSEADAALAAAGSALAVLEVRAGLSEGPGARSRPGAQLGSTAAPSPAGH
jgi:hypothetical protein